MARNKRKEQLLEIVNERLQTLAYGSALGLIVGWVLYIGKDIFVPIVFSFIVVYVIIGIARLLERVPLLGRAPPPARYGVSMLIIALGLAAAVVLVIGSTGTVAALAPRYQESLLVAIQRTAAFFRIEDEPTWTTLRQQVLARIDLQGFVAATFASVSSLAWTAIVVVLYAGFLLVERALFAAKVACLSGDPRAVARILGITADINAQIGSYLAVKTLLGILLGALSWLVMISVGLELAAFWAVLIALLNYVPYFGSIVGVFFPVLMAVVQFGVTSEVLAILLPLALIHFVVGNFLDPYLLARSLNLSPFVILVSLTVWVGLWGVPGAFVAVPITAIIVIVFSRFAGTRPVAVLLSRTGELRSGPS